MSYPSIENACQQPPKWTLLTCLPIWGEAVSRDSLVIPHWINSVPTASFKSSSISLSIRRQKLIIFYNVWISELNSLTLNYITIKYRQIHCKTWSPWKEDFHIKGTQGCATSRVIFSRKCPKGGLSVSGKDCNLWKKFQIGLIILKTQSHSMNIGVGGAAGAPKSWLLLYLASKEKLDPSIYQLGTSYKWICLWRVGGVWH